VTKEALINAVESLLSAHEQIESVSRIDGEDVIGIELNDGSEYFIEILEA
jgi:hypothetical protein